MPQTGITTIYYSFIDHLKERASDLALLQLVGRNEDYFVKELACFVHRVSEGTRLVLTNHGNRSEPKVDCQFLAGPSTEATHITTLIEVKYVRNRHRFWEYKATDEIGDSLARLAVQLAENDGRTDLGGIPVKLTGHNQDTYGLVRSSP